MDILNRVRRPLRFADQDRSPTLIDILTSSARLGSGRRHHEGAIGLDRSRADAEPLVDLLVGGPSIYLR